MRRDDTTEEEDEEDVPAKSVAKRPPAPVARGRGRGKARRTLRQAVGRQDTTSASESDVEDAKGSPGVGSLPRTSVMRRPASAIAPRTALPKSSGVFHYLQWVVTDVLKQEELEVLKAKAAKLTITVGSMCAGMGTEEIVFEGLRRSLQEHGASLRHQSVFKAEKDNVKMAFLQEHYGNKHTTFVWDNHELQKNTMTDVTGQAVQGRLQVDVLFCGIVCKDISPLSTKPKTERAKEGQSGSSLDGLLSYIRNMPLELRPKFLILECVQRLGHKRQVDPDNRQGTIYIKDELSTLGYCGDWRNVNAKEFFLPQSRPRVYGLFLKIDPKCLDERGRQQRDAECKACFDLVERMKVQGPPEPLAVVLQRCKEMHGDQFLPKSTAHEAQPASWELPPSELASDRVWRREHCNFAKTLALKDAELKEFHAFADAVNGTFQPRAIEGLWLKLVSEQRKRGMDWTKELLVASIGASLRFMSVRSDIFPCVTPHMTYAILQDRQLRSLTGVEALALQGIQTNEVRTFKFNTAKSNSTKLQDLAGNAFTANILAAFLVAGLLHK
jgi:site-specific DNA-cytosine methylase